MRSASSAGETITRGNQEVQISIPKRAETFNGASSSKESQLINFSAADMIKSRMYSSQASSSVVDDDGSMKSGCGASKAAGTANNSACKLNKAAHSNCSSSHTNSEESGESGYHSRLCMDFNHDADASESCSCSGASYTENSSHNEMVKIKNLLQTPNSNGTTSISKTHFESILKYILTDYVRIKNENENLKREVDGKNETIEQLRKALDDRKVNFIVFLFLICINFNFSVLILGSWGL
jgi:hypothetical protein